MTAFVLGDANVDLLINLPGALSDEQPRMFVEPKLLGGGTAANVSVALTRLGIQASIISVVGADIFGEFTRIQLENEGVQTQYLEIQPNSFTPVVIGMVQSDGNRVLAVWPPTNGAYTKLTKASVSSLDYSKIRWLHTTGIALRASPIRETVLDVMEKAKSRGVPVSLDLNLRLESWGWENDIRSTMFKAFKSTDYIFGSSHEEIIPLTSVKDAKEAAINLSKQGPNIISRLGQDGAILVTAQGVPYKLPSFPVQAIDTLGAGDAFDGGFIAAMLSGRDIFDAVRWGHATAAYKVLGRGARHLPKLDDIQVFLNSTHQIEKL